jgi:hypothetical protein
MLEHAAELPHRLERRSEAAPVISTLQAEPSLSEPSKTRPASTRRMRDHGIRAVVQAGVAFIVPEVDVL